MFLDFLFGKKNLVLVLVVSVLVVFVVVVLGIYIVYYLELVGELVQEYGKLLVCFNVIVEIFEGGDLVVICWELE